MNCATLLAHWLVEHMSGLLTRTISEPQNCRGSTSASRRKITDFEQAILAQVSDKWKPIKLGDGDGAFDLDELKRDISTSDVKFAVMKYKPSALILEYLASRAAKQQVPLPSLILSKSPMLKKKRSSEETVSRLSKRFNKGKQRPIYHMEQDPWDAEDEQT